MNVKAKGGDHEEKCQSGVHVLCERCGTPVEEIKLSTHMHSCPCRQGKEILQVVMAKDSNEVYIPPGEWPEVFPHTKEVYDLIIKLGQTPPFELPK
jgi:hypothetical protein